MVPPLRGWRRGAAPSSRCRAVAKDPLPLVAFFIGTAHAEAGLSDGPSRSS
ncbi:MAG: hypothetical protein Q4G69_09595 [Planctomycetia bacterium]|nr:hypothetical protein [Planctomycetia bacterium]